MRTFVLGIDIGTGSVKAVAINSEGKTLHTAAYSYAQQTGSEQDPFAIETCVRRSIRDCAQQLQAPSIISFSSAMHGLMVVDEKGQPLTKLITWQDARASKIAAAVRHTAAGDELYRHTGAPTHAMLPLFKIAWLREQAPELFQAASRFISIKEWIWFRLFGVFEIDHSIAGATGLFDPHTKDWHAPALQLAGIKAGQLSQLVPTTFIRHLENETIAAELKLPPHTAFCIGASDGCLANMGSAAITPGTCAVTIGTSAAVRIGSPTALYDAAYMPFSYLLDGQTFICGAPLNNGGNVIQWLVNSFTGQHNEQHSYTDIFQTLHTVKPGAEGLVFLPYLHGERAPVWNEDSRGVFFGVGQQHGHAHFIRAALEGLCFSIRQVLQLLEKSTQPIETLSLSGGLIRSNEWLQLLADITGKTVQVYTEEDASARGAALLGLNAMNMQNKVAEPGPQLVRYPQANQKEYDENFNIFCSLYPALHTLMKSNAD